jgi:hypothetical protein
MAYNECRHKHATFRISLLLCQTSCTSWCKYAEIVGVISKTIMRFRSMQIQHPQNICSYFSSLYQRGIA